MKPIVAQDQAKLSLARCVRLAVSGMSYRLLRSGITTAILALAVAFLVHVLTHAILAERVQRSAWESLEPTRQATMWLARLIEPDTPAEIQANLVPQREWWPRHRAMEYAQWWGDFRLQNEAMRAAEDLREIERWSLTLSPTSRAVLLGGLELRPWLTQLEKQSERRREWVGKLDELNLDPPLGSLEAFDLFLDRSWPTLKDATDEIRAYHRVAIEVLGEADDRPMLERFAEPRAPLVNELAEAGFVMTDQARLELEEYAAYQMNLAWLQDRLTEPRAQRWAEAELGRSDFAAVLDHLTQNSAALRWREAVGAMPYNPTEFTVAQRYAQTLRYQRVTQNYEPIIRYTPFGLPVGTLWLVGLSLLVCVVGVTNALLMSVTERFNEIATMKCLGAMDRSIMQMFVAEAVIQGVLGGTVGVALGLLLTALRGFAEFGTLFVRGLDGWADLLGAAGLSLGIGILLAAGAAIGPSWIASRLAPMEAMRVE